MESRYQALHGFHLPEKPVDVAIFCTTGKPELIFDDVKRWLENVINVMTIAEGAFFPWHYRPALALELERIAKSGGTTLTASGVQDGVMLHLAAAMSSMTACILEI